MTENNANASPDVQKLGELIRDIRIAMLTTVEEDGTLHIRPMATQQVVFDGDLWFFTEAAAPKVENVEHDEHVNIAYASESDHRYVSVSGTARLVRDRAKAEELWNPFVKAWFPKGVDDPNLALLKVSVQRAEYWESPNSGIVRLAGFAKALVTGKRYEGSENEKLDLEGAVVPSPS